ncbi:hypothetical protein J8M20_02965 [Pseudoalteromonas luteoviolacea]|uniref:hypothetical protein n=1 Tax=Pseudoalteromonas luteoviolacea TaxID=43657 RepID=UPI001B39A858|nr:hypothetical protein [Pseudoalteromonas luteoviolacea]MBQ4810276.1 hypothetical protein [Pseudoalteromonas luteoviolacea]
MIGLPRGDSIAYSFLPIIKTLCFREVMGYLFTFGAISIFLSVLIVWKILGSGKSEIKDAFRDFRSNFFSDLKAWMKSPFTHQGLADFSGMDILGAIFGSFLVFTFLFSIFIFGVLVGVYHLIT